MSEAKELAARLRKLAADPVLVADEARNSFEVHARMLERQAERIEALADAMVDHSWSPGWMRCKLCFWVWRDEGPPRHANGCLLAHAPGDKPHETNIIGGLYYADPAPIKETEP